MTDELMREINEELQRDRAINFFKKYTNHIVAVVTLAIAVVGGKAWYDASEVAAREKEGERYEQSLEMERSGKRDDAAKEYAALMEDDSRGYGALAAFRLSSMQLADGKGKEAEETFAKLANGGGFPAEMRELAKLHLAALRISAGEDGATAPGKPFESLYMELEAAGAMAKGDKKAAADALEKIKNDAGAPEGVKQRASSMAEYVGD